MSLDTFKPIVVFYKCGPTGLYQNGTLVLEIDTCYVPLSSIVITKSKNVIT